MRKGRVLAAAAALVLAAAWWWAGRPGEGPDQADERAKERFEALRARLGATAAAPLPEATGALEIGGRVVGPDGPIAFVTVTATRTEPGETMSELPCPCDHGCGRTLLELDCDEAARQLMELVVERRGEAQPVARATSDVNGRFTVSGLAAGSYGLWVDALAGVGFEGDVAAGAREVEIGIARGQKVRGSVADSRGKPIQGAIVTAVRAGHPRFFDTLSAGDGTFAFESLPPGRSAVVAVWGSLLPDHALVQQGDRGPLKLTLHNPRRLRGRVVQGQEPAAGVQVSVEGEHRKEKAVTGKDGRFEISRLRPGEYRVSARQGALQAERQVPVPKLADPLELVLDLERGGALAGSLRAETGEPIQEGEVSISGDEWGETTKVPVMVDGTFRADALAPGRFRVRASAKGFLTTGAQPVAVHSGGVTQVQLVLEPAARVEGTVLGPDGAPLAGARVAAVGKRVETVATTAGEGGHFALDGIAPGQVTLVATHDEYTAAVLEGAAPASGLVLRLGAPESLEGRVVTDSGAPVEGALVLSFRGRLTPNQVVLEGRSLVERQARTDRTGAFRLRGLEAGTVTLAVTASEASWQALQGPLTTRAVEVPASGQVTLELATGGKIAGTVTDASGRPLSGVDVYARLPAKQLERDVMTLLRRASATTGETGAFELSDLEAGEYEVATVMEGYKEALAPARVGDRDVKLALQLAPMIRGRVLRSSGDPVPTFMVNWQRVEAPDGRFSIPRKEGWETIVSINAGPDLPVIWRRVPAGTTDASLGDLVLGSGRKVTGRVVDAQTGEGISGALVYTADGRDLLSSWGFPPGEGAAVSAPDGSFVLPHVDDQAPALLAAHEDYQRVSAPLGTASDLELRLWHATRIVVELQRSTKQRVYVAAQAEQSGSAYPAVRDARGHYVISGLGEGRYLVRAVTDGDSVFLPVPVALPLHGEAHVTLVERTGEATLRVRVQGAGVGKGAALALVPGTAKPPSTLAELDRLFEAGLRPGRDGEVREFKQLPAGAFTIVAAGIEENPTSLRVVTVPVTVQGERGQDVDVVIPSDAPVFDLETGAGAGNSDE